MHEKAVKAATDIIDQWDTDEDFVTTEIVRRAIAAFLDAKANELREVRDSIVGEVPAFLIQQIYFCAKTADELELP